MADTLFRVSEVGLKARASIPAAEYAEYAEYKVLRHKIQTTALSQLDPAIRASTVTTLDVARKEVNTEHAAALKRLAGVGPQKQAKLQRRIDSLYDRITVGPANAPAILPAPGAGGIRAPHWRRGHFRAQPCGPARSSRKLIFVAPILIHADQLGGQAPPPKAYELIARRTGH